MGAYTLNYRFHSSGLVDLLQRNCKRGRVYGDVTQQIYYSTFHGEVSYCPGPEPCFVVLMA
jgi:hypothetical protein